MKKSITALLILTLLVLAPIWTVSASAEGSSGASEKSDKEVNNSLTVHFFVQINGVDTPLPGAEIGIYKAAELKYDSVGNAYYQLLPRFKSLTVIRDGRDVTFDGVAGTSADALVSKIESFNAPVEFKAVTNENGDARFEALSSGIYIVKELSATGLSDEYELFAPYFIAVPYGELGKNGYEWQYEVISDPKTVIKPKEKPSEPTSIPVEESSESSVSAPSEPTSDYPDSGEAAADRRIMISLIIMAMFGSALLMTILNGKKRGDDN